METVNQITEIDFAIICGTIAVISFFLIKFYKRNSRSASRSSQNM